MQEKYSPEKNNSVIPFEENIPDLIKDLDEKILFCDKTAKDNQKYDIRFKKALLIVGFLIIFCSSLTSTLQDSDYTRWSTFFTILFGGVSTALSGFAFNQFNFARRQQIWNMKATTYRYLCNQLKYLEPEKKKWLQAMNIVDSWGDNTSPEEAKLQIDYIIMANNEGG